MKRAGAVALLVVTLALTGCSGEAIAQDDFDTISKLRQKCEDADGVFTTWLYSDGFGRTLYGYECDLSTHPDEKR